MSRRECTADPDRIEKRFGDRDPESFFYRREFLNEESELLVEKGIGIFENGGTDYEKQLRLLRIADNVPEGGRPKVVREFFETVDDLEKTGNGLSLLQTGQYCLGMRSFCYVRPRDAALTVAMEGHFEKCSGRVAFCHLCSAVYSAVSGIESKIGILDRAQISTRRIHRVAPGDCKVLGRDTNTGICKRVRTEDTVLFSIANKKMRRSDFGLSKKVFLEDRQYGNEIIADCKFSKKFCFLRPFFLKIFVHVCSKPFEKEGG